MPMVVLLQSIFVSKGISIRVHTCGTRAFHRRSICLEEEETRTRESGNTPCAEIGMTTKYDDQSTAYALFGTLIALLVRCLVWHRNCAVENENEQVIFSNIELRGEYR